MKSVIEIETNPEEGIIKNDSFSKFETIDFSKQNKFPYCLVGKITSEFELKKINKFGVGILIGPNVVLTAGHNLTNIDKESGNFQIADSVSFTVGANGDFEPFETIKSVDFHLPEDFIQGVKEQIAKKQLLNDWAVIYLSVPIGEAVKKLYNLENLSYVQTAENGLFNFFNDNTHQNLSKLGGNDPEISIIGYSEYKIDNCDENKTTPNDIQGNPINNINSSTLRTNKTEEEAKKDFNINIQISTNEEGLVASSIFSNNLNQLNIVKLENNKKGSTEKLDYVILNTENKEVNKLKEHQTRKYSGRTFMSESKGKLDGFDDALKYKISTYKGQSGSPIFLRLRKFSSLNQNTNFHHQSDLNEHFFVDNINNIISHNDGLDYIYIFIGIHSRRGPLLYDNIVSSSTNIIGNLDGNCNNSTNNNNLIQNTNDEDYYGENKGDLMFLSNNNTVGQDEEVDKVETQVKKMKSRTNEHRLSLNGSFSKENNKPNKNDLLNLISIHGICEFNEGILIMGNKVLPISNQVEARNCKEKKQNGNFIQTSSNNLNNINSNNNTQNNNSNNNNSYQLTYYNNSKDNDNVYKSSYCNVTLNLNGKVKLSGIFKRDLKMEILFNFGAEIMNIDKSNIIFISNIGMKNEKRINGKHDNSKQLNIFIDDNLYNIVFEVDINMKYGDELGQKVLEKYMENYDLDIQSIKENFKQKHMKALFDSIFDEIANFSDIHPTFGRLFSKIRSYVLNKIGLLD